MTGRASEPGWAEKRADLAEPVTAAQSEMRIEHLQAMTADLDLRPYRAARFANGRQAPAFDHPCR